MKRRRIHSTADELDKTNCLHMKTNALGYTVIYGVILYTRRPVHRMPSIPISRRHPVDTETPVWITRSSDCH